jgi:hypothetical protein
MTIEEGFWLVMVVVALSVIPAAVMVFVAVWVS